MIALIATVALVADTPPVLRQPPGGVPALMPVYGVSTDGRGVTVQLQPAGCNTVKSDFTVAISKAVDRPTILFARRSPTTALVACKAQPSTVEITWSYDDLGLKPGQPFSLANPLVMAP
jgi:hypothetical protein